MKQIVIGLDPSINSTGICVRDIDNTFHKYYLFTCKATKKTIEWAKSVNWLDIYEYEKRPINNIDRYSEKENIKFDNLIRQVDNIMKCVGVLDKKYIIKYVVMEGVSYGSVSGAALIDLSFLNAMIRTRLSDMNIDFYIVSPKEVKKQSVGNGNADKDLMIMSWKKLDRQTLDMPDWVKCDDIADAYFMSHFDVNS